MIERRNILFLQMEVVFQRLESEVGLGLYFSGAFAFPPVL